LETIPYDFGNLFLISATNTLLLSNEASIFLTSIVFLATFYPQITFPTTLATLAIIGPWVAIKVAAAEIVTTVPVTTI